LIYYRLHMPASWQSFCCKRLNHTLLDHNCMKTFLDWSAYQDAGLGDAYADIPKTGGDFAKAVAVCINSRACEANHDKGVMCPSYRVTNEANLSTGGRVRLLKAALNAGPGEPPFADPTLRLAMDLCVSCKGCKRECENEVDMALIKVEYLAQLNAIDGPSLRSRMFARIPLCLHRWPWLGSFVALRNQSRFLARLGEKLLRISARPLPVPAPTSFQAPTGTPSDIDETGGREVVLWVDTFSRYFDPDIAEAALAVLQAAGYTVIFAQPVAGADEPARPLCCGRTWLAQGMVEKARQEARRTLAALLPHAEAGRPIIGLEPSCLLAFRDEYKALGLGEAALTVARQALLFEEFIAKEHSAQNLRLALKPAEGHTAPLLVHGHCHQKAVGAMKSMRKVLKLIPGLEFEFIESACCGMAGNFGLEAEHTAIAMDMAEQALLPKLREAPQAKVLSNGFSCRQQIRDNDGRSPSHLAQLLRDALA
jgi:Fe-S oxidoreductase